jgi:hypothetical protein
MSAVACFETVLKLDMISKPTDAHKCMKVLYTYVLLLVLVSCLFAQCMVLSVSQLSVIRLVKVLVISDSRYILWMRVRCVKCCHRGYS